MLRRGGSTCPNIEPTWWTKQRGYTNTNCVSILLWTFECKQQIDLNVYRPQQNRNRSHLSHPFTPSSHFQVCGESRMEETASVCSKVLVCVVSVVVIDVETVAEVVVFTDVVVHVVTVSVVDVVVIVVAVSEVVVIVVTVTEVVVCVVTVAVTEVVVRVVAVTEVVVTVVAVADTDLSAPASTHNWPYMTGQNACKSIQDSPTLKMFIVRDNMPLACHILTVAAAIPPRRNVAKASNERFLSVMPLQAGFFAAWETWW